MNFFWDLKYSHEQTAAIEEDKSPISYGELDEYVKKFKKNLSFNRKTLGIILCGNNIASMVGYITALQEGQAVSLLADNIEPELFNNIVQIYKPEWIWKPNGLGTFADFSCIYEDFGYEFIITNTNHDSLKIHKELALLLSTSGTTGSPKMVRLSYHNLQSNALSIANYLNLSNNEKAITTLPMQYSFGLSVINSHLLVGGTLILTDHGVMSKQFWKLFNDNKATSIAGVPYIYQILHRLRIDQMKLPSLRKLTQAGGRLDENLTSYFLDYSENHNLKFYVMYGQTEATARISYVPSDQLSKKIGTIGVSIPGGKLELDPNQQLIYSGPNVMMGYAESREDMALGDINNGRLETGDIAYKDDDGFFYITGRMKRFIKLFGLRINLDDVEKMLENKLRESCYCTGNDNKMTVFVNSMKLISAAKSYITETYHLHPSSFKIVHLDEVPRFHTGKVDYKALLEWSEYK
jgi:long-chain acyl-CoA synthetase